MIIHGLVPDTRRPGSTRVLVGGRPAWTVPADLVSGLGLQEGQLLSAAAVAQLDAAAEEEGAVRSALRSLERRAHGAMELGRKLERKGHGKAAVGAALARLGRLGVLDDLDFARAYIAARAARGRGPERLRRDLSELGVAAEVAQQALAESQAEVEDPLAQPLALARKRAAQMKHLPTDTRRRRLAAFLARRGFHGADVRGVMESVLREG